MAIGINNFVRRQTQSSKFSHFAGTFDELSTLVEENFSLAQPGYMDGAMLVPLPSEGFFSGVVEVTAEMPLVATFSARRKGEEPYLQIEAISGQKLPAKFVEAVVYRHDTLGEDATTAAEWEIVSLNGRPTEEPEPLTPVAMARNFLQLPGGTEAVYTAEEFASSIMYWSKRAMCG